LEGKPAVTLNPGEVLFIPAGTVQEVRNVGNGNVAELATYVVEKGQATRRAGEVSAQCLWAGQNVLSVPEVVGTLARLV
jgi:hypothetical protein